MSIRPKVTLHHTVEEYFNRKLADFFDSLPRQEDRDIAAKTISFIMNTYPETQAFLRGELVHEESWESR